MKFIRRTNRSLNTNRSSRERVAVRSLLTHGDFEADHLLKPVRMIDKRNLTVTMSVQASQ